MRTVVFRIRPDLGRDIPFADVRGEMRDFNLPIELRKVGRGWWEAACDLGPGTYSYKFKLAGEHWVLDPLNPRTRGADGVRNNLLVVDGAEEPLLHAPAPPWADVEDSGLLAVRAGLRRGAGDETLRLRWNEGQGWRETAMTPVADEDEHRLFEAKLPVSAREVEYVFRLADERLLGAAGGPGQSFRLALSDVTRDVPGWWKDAVLYTIFVDRFRRGGAGGAWPAELAEPGEARAGGDLDGIVEALPHLVDLGVTALHLTPVSVAPSAHRYDAIDPRAVDPALGGEAALVRLLEAAHGRGIGMRVLLDLAVTHVHMDHRAFRHVRDHGPASPWWDWFLATRWPFAEDKLDPGYQHYQKGQWREPLLNLSTPEVADDLVETFERWTRLGADGFRIDAAADVPLGLLERIGRAVRALAPEAVVYGEVIPEHLHRYLAHGLDAATDFAAQEALYDWLWRDRPGGASRAAAGLARRRFSRGAQGFRAIGFTATHDQHRLLTLTGSPERARLALLAVLMRPEIPAIYYGDEVGLRAASADKQFEGAWTDRQPMTWDRARWDADTLALVRAGIAARRGSRALSRGDAVALPALVAGGGGASDEATLALRRVDGDEVVDVYLHGGPTTVCLELGPDAPPAARPLVSLGRVEVDEAQGRVTLGPWSGVALAREPTAERAAAFEELVAANRALAALAFREGATLTLSLPAHLYLTVTEACNLRCAHCLTHAPRLTREHRARHMMPWVLEALREPFAAASYFGFSHGGESLVAPHFFDALAAIGRARQGRPGRTDVHLLTNGMLLTPDRARRLADGGVTSLAVSIDGASAATNDALRLGARLETVLEHVGAALELRSRRGWDLRVGISFVVGQCNVEELPALGALVRDLGVDWLKLEEMHPSTFRARQEMLRPGDPRLASGVTAVREILGRAGVVLVDHLVDRPECRCQAAASPDALAFRDADDFANRARFNPCRAAWEQACVDPDGTVHPVDYFEPPLGNLLDASLFDLWISPPAQRARAAALRRVPQRLRSQCREGIE
jgi:glycosidase/MoaA/NifB/PqqE/SkfB family radical SAM enzyme